jgi:predicted transcriptional regulator
MVNLQLRGNVSVTDIELLIALYQAPRTTMEINALLQLEKQNSHGPYTSRLRNKKLIVSERGGSYLTFKLSPEGVQFVEAIKNSIQREVV